MNNQSTPDKTPTRISNEQLFNEPFKPAWMRRQEQDARWELDLYVTKGIEKQWKKEAAESRRKISAAYPPSKKRTRA